MLRQFALLATQTRPARRTMLAGVAAIIAQTTLTTVALANDLNITNRTGQTVYRLYAWPSDLVPRSFDILGQALTNLSTRRISIDNSYRDCLFTFQFDYNNPVDMKRRGYKKKYLVIQEVDLCTSEAKKGIELKRWGGKL